MEWYEIDAVKFEMIKFTQNKECFLLSPSFLTKEEFKVNYRPLRIHAVHQLDYVKAKLKGKLFNWYSTLASYENGCPSGKTEDKEKRDSWKEEHWREIKTYRWLIDIDSPTLSKQDIMTAHAQARKIFLLLDYYKLPFEIRHSGKGFHIIVDDEPFRKERELTYQPFEDNSIYSFFTKLSKIIHDHIADMVDWKIPDSRRVCKIPYSIAIYSSEERVCYPFLNVFEFMRFSPEDAKLMNWSPEKIRNRGTHKFNENEQNPKTKEFIKYLIDKE